MTGGKYLNRKVQCPKGEIRPAMDRMRESLFSILGPMYGKNFLDLFSGSGLMAIEAASRGCSPVVLVEKESAKRKTILENLSFVEEETMLYICSAQRYIQTTKKVFDIIYLDPPFPMPNKKELIVQIEKEKIFHDDSIILIHYPAEERSQWPLRIGVLKKIDERVYGRSHVLFYKKESDGIDSAAETGERSDPK